VDKKEFNAKEVKAKDDGWYFVTLFQFVKEKPEYPNNIKDWVKFNGKDWEYGDYDGTCYVCFIHKRED